MMALEFCFLGVNMFSAEGKDGSPMGVVRQGGVHITCSVKRNRSKSHIILHSTAKLLFAAKQLFIPPLILLEIPSGAS